MWSNQVCLVASVHLFTVFDILYAADELLLIQFRCAMLRHKVIVQSDFWLWFLQLLWFTDFRDKWIDLISVEQASDMNIFLRCCLSCLLLLILSQTFQLYAHLLRHGCRYFVQTLFNFRNQGVLLQPAFKVQIAKLVQDLDRTWVPHRLLLRWLQATLLCGLSAL